MLHLAPLLTFLCVLAAVYSDVTTCVDDDGLLTCHFLAHCVNNVTCECQPGTSDVSDGNGTNCNPTGFAFRSVVNTMLIRMVMSVRAIYREQTWCVAHRSCFGVNL